MAHVAGYLQSEHTRLIAVADAWDVRRASVGGTFSQGSMLSLKPLFEESTLGKRWQDLGARVYDDVADIGADSDIDLVSLCTPDDLHERHAVSLLEAGKDLILEKPVALTRESARRIADAAAASGRQVAVNYEIRINPAVRKLRELVSSGALGDVQAFSLYQTRGPFRRDKWESWIQSKERSGGLIVEETCHWFDLARFVTGKEFASVHCVANDRVHAEFDYEDIAYAAGAFSDGSIFHVGHALTGFAFSLQVQVHGRAGTAWCGLKDNPHSVLDAGQTDYVGIVCWGGVEAGETEPQFTTFGDEALEAQNIRDHVIECAARLVAGQSFRVGLGDGIAALDISLAASESARTGTIIHLERPQ